MLELRRGPTGTGRTTPFPIALRIDAAPPVKTPELLCRCQRLDFCQLTKELGGALTEDQIYADDTLGKPWKARQNPGCSAIVKWISPTRFVVSEESQWQVKERDPSATLGQYGEAEKLEDESNESAALYDASFNAEGECELLPADKTRVVSTQPVKEQKTNE